MKTLTDQVRFLGYQTSPTCTNMSMKPTTIWPPPHNTCTLSLRPVRPPKAPFWPPPTSWIPLCTHPGHEESLAGVTPVRGNPKPIKWTPLHSGRVNLISESWEKGSWRLWPTANRSLSRRKQWSFITFKPSNTSPVWSNSTASECSTTSEAGSF